MALAWKAGWVHALTSSNLVSSAATPREGRFALPLPAIPGFTSWITTTGLSLSKLMTASDSERILDKVLQNDDAPETLR